MNAVEITHSICKIEAFLPETTARCLDEIVRLSLEENLQYNTRELALYFAVEELLSSVQREIRENKLDAESPSEG